MHYRGATGRRPARCCCCCVCVYVCVCARRRVAAGTPCCWAGGRWRPRFFFVVLRPVRRGHHGRLRAPRRRWPRSGGCGPAAAVALSVFMRRGFYYPLLARARGAARPHLLRHWDTRACAADFASIVWPPPLLTTALLRAHSRMRVRDTRPVAAPAAGSVEGAVVQAPLTPHPARTREQRQRRAVRVSGREPHSFPQAVPDDKSSAIRAANGRSHRSSDRII